MRSAGWYRLLCGWAFLLLFGSMQGAHVLKAWHNHHEACSLTAAQEIHGQSVLHAHDGDTEHCSWCSFHLEAFSNTDFLSWTPGASENITLYKGLVSPETGVSPVWQSGRGPPVA
jgi:hypothetical protein